MATKGFNLLRPQLSPPTAWDKIYQWMVGTARVIVILVQIIVIGAFGFRIYVDTIGKKLDEEVQKKDLILESYKGREAEIKGVQKKADLYKELWELSSDHTRYMEFINQNISNYSGIISVGINKNDITITGEIPNNSIAQLEDAMKTRELPLGMEYDPNSDEMWFRDVNLDTVDSEGSDPNEIASFSITILLFTKPKDRIIDGK